MHYLISCKISDHRPMGVTIIAILTIISGILFLLSGIALVALGSFSVNPVDTTISTNTSSFTCWKIILWHNFCGSRRGIFGNRYWISCYVLWAPKRKRMGVDYNYNITYYWNCDTNSFHFCWKCIYRFFIILITSVQEL